MTDQTKALVVSNYDKIKALARNETTIKRFADMIGSRREASAYITSAMLAVANSEELKQCTPSSIFNSVMRAAALRLSCDPALRQAHLVPFRNKKAGTREAQIIVGYIGLQNLAQRTGKYRWLNAAALYEGQIIEIDQLTGAPAIRGRKESSVALGYYHYFELLSGYRHILYMTVEELRAHGERYAPFNPMWKTDFEAMCLKTVTRLHLLKHGVLDPFDRSIIAEATEEIDDGEIVGEMVDAQFTDADDAMAEEAAAQEAEEKAAKKPDPKKIMHDLGFDDTTKSPEPAQPEEPPQAEAAPAPPANLRAMALEEAEAETSSDGTPYGEIETEELANRANTLGRKLKDKKLTDEQKMTYERKLAAILTILAARQKEG